MGALGDAGAIGLAAVGVISLPIGLADIASGRPFGAIGQGVGQLTGPNGPFAPHKPTSCPVMHMNGMGGSGSGNAPSEGMGPHNPNPGGADAPSEPGNPPAGDLGPQGPGEAPNPGGQGPPPEDPFGWNTPGYRDLINQWNDQYYGPIPPSWN